MVKSISLKPHHCGISVPDINAAIKWYGDILEFTLKMRMTIDEIDAHIAFIQNGDFQIELFEVKNAAPLPENRRQPDTDLLTHGTKHIAFEVKNLKEFADELKQRGVDIAMEFREMPDGKVVFIRDNAGIPIELVEH